VNREAIAAAAAAAAAAAVGETEAALVCEELALTGRKRECGSRCREALAVCGLRLLLLLLLLLFLLLSSLLVLLETSLSPAPPPVACSCSSCSCSSFARAGGRVSRVFFALMSACVCVCVGGWVCVH